MKRALILMVILTLAVTACGGSAGGGGGGGTTTTTTLSQTATSADSTLTVKYPEGWTARSEFGSQIMLANKAEVLDNVNLTNFGDDQVAVMTMAQSLEGMPEMPLKDLAGTMATSLSGEGTLSEPTELEINGSPAVSLTGTIKQGEQEAGTQILMMQNATSNALLIFVLATKPGDESKYTDTLRAIAGSATFGAAAEATPES